MVKIHIRRKLLGEGWFKKANYDEQTGIHTITIPKDGTGSYIIEAAGAIGGTIRDAEENNIEISLEEGYCKRYLLSKKKEKV